jgi:NAD+ synthase (glutamine-hydrolysing)
MGRLRVAACQVNTKVGDLDGNAERILGALDDAEAAGADVALFPELAITGYPPEDLLLKPGFVEDNVEVLHRIAARTGRCAAVVGFADPGLDLYNAAAVCAEGRVQGVYHKRLLPNYAVFDEQRYFTPGSEPLQLYVIAGCGSASRSARTSGARPVRCRCRRPVARSSSSTSTRRPTTPAASRNATACSPRGRPTRRAASST